MRERARELRQRQSNAETLLWSLIRNSQLGCKFRRQHVLGPYIVDFACLQRRLIIELDGEQHDEEQTEYDLSRQNCLESMGYTVIRFWTCDFFQNVDEILEQIQKTLKVSPPIKSSPWHGACNSSLSQP